MNNQIIMYKNGTREPIMYINEFEDGEIRFVTNSGVRYVYFPKLNNGVFAKQARIVLFNASGKPEVVTGLVVDETVRGIRFPRKNSVEYTFGPISGKIEIAQNASIEEIKNAIDRDIWKQMRKIPADSKAVKYSFSEREIDV